MFEKVANEMGFTPFNYLSGNIYYHNYGQNRWVDNSKSTVNDVDILVFVINESHGEITWKTEYNEAITTGKNFIVMCLRETYEHYRYIKNKFIKIPDELPENDKLIFKQIDFLESMHQTTVVPFELRDFEWKLKEQILTLLRFGLSLSERNNKKSTFLPVLKSSIYKSQIDKYKNPLYESIAREILFDIFEAKELRKRTLDYFAITKSLTDDEIISLFSDVEDGICRKAMVVLGTLLGENHNVGAIFAAAIESSSENDVGFVRRLIASCFDISIPLSIRHLPGLFPCQDIGTPRRIINQISHRISEIRKLISSSVLSKEEVINLINLCLNYKSEQGWKDLGNSIITDLKETVT
ncbi:MAG: hypothetical protein HGB15_09775 [Chlorobaculum sp.]|nr:hypothetical protein [Chlorobaculum sp.]